jgi:hypothetical protein
VAERKSGEEIIAPAPHLPQARFGVIAEHELAELAREKQEFGDSHLLTGVAYARAGLLRETESEFAAPLQTECGVGGSLPPSRKRKGGEVIRK